MTDDTELKARPDSFVLLFPTPWKGDETALLQQVHGEVWMEESDWNLSPSEKEDVRFTGSVLLDGREATIVVEEAIPELIQMVPRALDAFAASEIIQLENHESIWRVVTDGGGATAKQMIRLMSTFIEAGSPGVFIPANVQMHSPRTIKRQAMEPDSPQTLTNLLVSAWHADDWMRTRGLTAFGFPELETVVDTGLNAAYFRLMDVAANMISRGSAFEGGQQLLVGHETYEIVQGPNGLEVDEQVPISGTFGVQTVVRH